MQARAIARRLPVARRLPGVTALVEGRERARAAAAARHAVTAMSSTNRADGGNGGREMQRKIGRRVLRAGQIIKIVGFSGDFRIRHFDGEEVAVYGGPPGYEMHRSFFVDRIGRRPRKTAEHCSDAQAR